ncbi:MAG: hypothetical protein ABEI32_11695 [Halothece sp.]
MKMMNLMTMMNDMASFLGEAIARIFSPNDDAYPNVGVQPYSGEVFHGNVKLNW